MFNTANQKEIDNWNQDQTTAPFHRYFMSEDKTDITLTSAIIKNDTEINVSVGHGFTAGGEYMLINYGNYIQQTKVISVTDDLIEIESPVGIDIGVTGCQIIRGIIEMNADYSASPKTFYCRIGANANAVDIQHLHLFMLDQSPMDEAKYGGIAALTNGFGTFVRREEKGVGQNLGYFKSNSGFKQFGGISTYDEKAPSGFYSVDFSFNIKETYGVVFRLWDNSDYISMTINGNLSGLDLHRLVATGQITLGE